MLSLQHKFNLTIKKYIYEQKLMGNNFCKSIILVMAINVSTLVCKLIEKHFLMYYRNSKLQTNR